MDPNANLAEQRALVERVKLGISYEEEVEHYDLIRLAELVEAMDEWLSKGGFLPVEWSLRASHRGRSLDGRLLP